MLSQKETEIIVELDSLTEEEMAEKIKYHCNEINILIEKLFERKCEVELNIYSSNNILSERTTCISPRIKKVLV